jgi:hypothetical protein
MSEITYGLDALAALNGGDEDQGGGMEFSPLKSGTTYTVKVIGIHYEIDGKKKVMGDFISYFNYGIFKKVNSFVAKNPSKKSAKGYPVDNLTPWDKAWKYHQDLSKEFQDKHSQEAYKYKPAQKFAFGFFDLDQGKEIIVDLTKNQAKAVNEAIEKYGKKLDKLAFELSKTGQSTSTKVSLTPIIDMDEDLTDKQRANFDKAPKEFDRKLFEGLLYEADEDEMVKSLIQAGFDVSLIGYDTPTASEPTINDEDVPLGDENTEDDPTSQF